MGFLYGRWYLLDVVRQKMEYWQLKDRAIAWHRQWKADALVIRGASSGYPSATKARQPQNGAGIRDRRIHNHYLAQPAIQPVQFVSGAFLQTT